MPWTGPTQNLSDNPLNIAALQLKQRQQDFENALEVARAGNHGPMAIAPPSDPYPGMSVADSPALDPLQSLQDPLDRARQAGEVQATAQDSADETRFNALQGMPGITPRNAARIVYGRSGVLDSPDPDEVRSALSNYVASPSRDTAAAAVRAGASLNQFPDRFLPVVQNSQGTGELPDRAQAPVPGSPEYFAMQQKMEDMRVAGAKAEIAARSAATASNDPFAAARRDAQQTRLALDEARRDSPRPSKVPDTIVGKDASGRTTMIPNPAKAQATADSVAYDANTVQPLKRRFTALSEGNTATPSPTATANAAQIDGLKQQANDAIGKILGMDLSQDDKIARTQEVHRRLNAKLLQLAAPGGGGGDNNDDQQ